jgi:Cof subfamily protein (haloacid dehalogenase superfamily)
MDNSAKAIFFDIDGTLINRKGGPFKDDLEAMEQAVRQGNLLFLNTGRSFSNIPDTLLDLPLWSGIAAGGGAHVLLKETREGKPLYNTFYHKWVDERFLFDFCAWYLKSKKSVVLEGERDCYVINPNRKYDEARKLKVINQPEDLFSKYPRDLISKMTIDGGCNGFINGERELLEGYFDTNIFPDYVEAIIKGEDKGKAIGIILDAIGIERKHSIALGDNINDIGMLRFAGLGVAMGNAHAETKAAAAWVTKNCGEGGAAEVLRRFVIKAS